jgi:hypothetical protein
MHISGDNITTFLCRVKPEYRPKTTLGLSWIQTASGVWRATDRGALSDTYEVDVRLYSRESAINTFINNIYANRHYDTNYFYMDGFESTEHIFGEDVDYTSPLAVTVLAIKGPVQKTWLGYEVVVTLRALSPTFVYDPTLVPLKHLDYGYKGGVAEITLSKYDSYYGKYTYTEHMTDVGLWEGTFTFSVAEMGQMRRYLATVRGDTVTIPGINGVAYPFGPTRPGYPIKCKVINYDDLGMVGVHNWKMKLTLAEEI